MQKAIQLVPAMEEGGVERYVARLNGILVSAGWENIVVSRGGKLDAEIEKAGGRVVHQEMKSKNPLTALGRAWRLRQLLKREKPDVVCAHSRVPAWLFVLASRGLGIKWITYAHGANSISRYSRVMTKGDLVMCPSNFVREYLMKAYGVDESRFRVVPHGIDAERFDPAKVDKAFVEEKRREWGLGEVANDELRMTNGGEEIPCVKVVMSIGRITRLKGFDTLIRAVARMTNEELRITNDGRVTPSEKEKPNSAIHNSSFITRHSPIKLIIVGGAEKGKEAYLDELKALVRELGMDKTVVFAGQQSKTPECLSIADVVVSANKRKPESFGLSMAEALAMGKPVVAKAFGGALDIVRDGIDGVLVGNRNEELGNRNEELGIRNEELGNRNEELGIRNEGRVVSSNEDGDVVAFAEAIAEVLEKVKVKGQGQERNVFDSDAIRASARERFDFGIMADRTMAVYEEVAR